LLQWGRRFLTAETGLVFPLCFLSFRLQWGRRFLTAETRSGKPHEPGGEKASMGPPFFDGGNETMRFDDE